MSDPKLYHLLGDTSPSLIGPNPIVGGIPVFDPSCAFGTPGFKAEDSVNYISFSLAGSDYNNFQKFSLSFFSKYYEGITNGVPAYTGYIIPFSLYYGSTGARYELYQSTDGSKTNLFSCGYEGNLTWPASISANQSVHWMIIVDVDGIEGSADTVRVYLNNVLVHSNSHSPISSSEMTLFLGTELGTWYGLIANNTLKVFDHALSSTERSWNYNNQGLEPVAPVTPTGLVASNGTYPDKVSASWNASSGATTYQLQRSNTFGGTYSDVSGWQAGLSFDDTTVTPGVTYYYKVKAQNTGGESALSSAVSGYAQNTAPTHALVYDIPVTKQSKIIINGFDIYKAGYVAKLFNVTEQKTFARSKLIFNDFNLDVNNFTDAFSRDNPKSLFYGLRLYQPVQIYNRDGLLIFDGVMLNLTRDHIAKTASIEISDTMQTFARTKVEYFSADWETPAMAVKNLMDKYNASDNYDLASIQTSDALYHAANNGNGVFIKCDIELNANTYLTNFIEKLAEIGCADAFIHKNLIRFDHWKTFTKPASSLINLDISDLIQAPNISILFSEVVNDYRIRYAGDNGIAVTDSTAPGVGHNIGALSRQNLAVYSLPELRTTETSQVAIKDVNSAVYFGECLIRRTHTNLLTNPNPLQVIDIILPIQDREWIDILSYFALTFPEEGWDKKIFEVMKISYDDDENQILLTAYEVGS